VKDVPIGTLRSIERQSGLRPKIHYYRALLEPGGKGRYGVAFSDFPGGVSAAVDAEAAVVRAAGTASIASAGT
jgi:hypothetical protein